MRRQYKTYARILKGLHVAVAPFPRDLRARKRDAERLKRLVIAYEYVCLGTFAQKYMRLPECNERDRHREA